MAKEVKRKRLVRGVDWHGYGFIFPKCHGQPESEWTMCHFAQVKPTSPKPASDGKWVKVKFIKVKLVEVK